MRKKSCSKHAIISVLSLAFMMTLFSHVSFAETSQITRLSGNDRYKTAVEISRQGWDKSDYAVIARGDDFADALSSGPLARKYNAPILLTQTNELSSDVLNELKRLEVKTVIIVGGTGAVSDEVAGSLKAVKINGSEPVVERIFGSDRIETSVKVAEKMGSSTKIAIATAYDYPDALSIASIASSEGMPILLTGKDSLPGTVKSYIENNRDKIQRTYIIGGSGVISSNIEEDVISPLRLGGANRYETNIAVMAAFIDYIDFQNIYMAVGDGPSGSEFADALSGTALAARTASPVVLMYKTVHPATQTFLSLVSPSSAKVTALGGAAVVPDSALEGLADAIKAPAIASTLVGNPWKGSGQQFKIATVAKDEMGQPVKIRITVTGGKDVAAIEYKDTKDGNYYPLSFDVNNSAWYGPEEGISFSDEVYDFQASFIKPGNFSYRLEVVQVNDNKVLACYNGSVNVIISPYELEAIPVVKTDASITYPINGSSIDSGTLTIRWNAVEGATGYAVDFTDLTWGRTFTPNIETNQATIFNDLVLPGHKYKATVYVKMPIPAGKQYGIPYALPSVYFSVNDLKAPNILSPLNNTVVKKGESFVLQFIRPKVFGNIETKMILKSKDGSIAKTFMVNGDNPEIPEELPVDWLEDVPSGTYDAVIIYKNFTLNETLESKPIRITFTE